MQIICTVAITAEEYVAGEQQKQILPPEQCPHCSGTHAFRALGYYGRYLSGIEGQIIIRRFRCRYCRRTVSMLPWFIQPYRFLQNYLFDMFMEGQDRSDTAGWQELLQRYWRQFCREIPDLADAISTTVFRSPESHDPKRWWHFLHLRYGGVAMITQGLVVAFQRTMFGKYNCHRAISPSQPILDSS